MRIVYVAGRFSASDQWQRAKNVRAAESLAFAVAEAGAMPLNPLANTCNFFGTLSEETLWYPGTLELMRRCDAMILVPGWEGSRGVAAEIEEAKRINMPVFERVDELKKWLVAGAFSSRGVLERKAQAFDQIVVAGRICGDDKESFVGEVDDIVYETRGEIGEIPDPTKETV